MFFFKMENGVISGPGFELRDRGTTASWSHNILTVYQALGREPTPNLKMSPQLMLLIPIGRQEILHIIPISLKWQKNIMAKEMNGRPKMTFQCRNILPISVKNTGLQETLSGPVFKLLSTNFLPMSEDRVSRPNELLRISDHLIWIVLKKSNIRNIY